MPLHRKASQFVLLSLLTTILTATFLFIAPVSARYLHTTFGRTSYWAFSMVSAVALFLVLPEWALAQVIVLLLVGVYSEMEQQKISRFYSGMTAVTIAAISGFFCVAVWAQNHKMGFVAFLKKNIQQVLTASDQLKALPVKVDAASVLTILPATAAIGLMLLICLSVVFVRTKDNEDRLTLFAIPDFMIWVFIATLAGTFLLDPVKMFYAQKVFSNVFFVTLAAYYFQGLAMVGFLFKHTRINYFLKAGLFFILAVHLFMFVIALGLSEVWFNYRSKEYKDLIKNNPYVGD